MNLNPFLKCVSFNLFCQARKISPTLSWLIVRGGEIILFTSIFRSLGFGFVVVLLALGINIFINCSLVA